MPAGGGGMIQALVLAAGESMRMGMLKPLLRFGETTFLEQIIGVLRRSEVDGITVVLGAKAETVRVSVDLSQVNVVINEGYREGQLSSLIAGLRSIAPAVEAIVLCLVDHPFITAETVSRLIGAFGQTRKPIVLPVFGGRRGHPALFAREVFDELIGAPAQEGARHVVQANRDRVFEVEVADGAVLTKIDTPEEYFSHFGCMPSAVWAGRARDKT
jgi:molybdenum cofactor cytidylyltransferase